MDQPRDILLRLRIDVELAQCCQGRLSQANASIVRWHSMVCPEIQRTTFMKGLQIFQEQLVLENSARENDRVQAVGVRHLGQRAM